MNSAKVGRLLFLCILGIILFASGMHVMGQSPPTATTGAASAVGSYEATLNGTVNANGESTTVYFEYGLNTSYGRTWPADQSPVTGTTDTAVSATLYELLPNTTYHYRVVAQNATATTYGADMSFTTLPSPPVAVTEAATGIGPDVATLNGMVNPNGANTTVTFEYGTDTSYGTTVTADQSPLTTNLNFVQPVSKTITGLSSGVTYHYRVVAVNTGGTSYGADMTFTIAASPPTTTTNPATAVGSDTATLNGTVNANGSETTVTFEYGLDTSYGRTTIADQNPVGGTSDTAVSAVIEDVIPNTTYHYRVVAVNAGGTSNGADMIFTTLPSPPTAVTNAASAVSTTGATLNGTVNANDGSTTVTFEYGTDTGYGTTVTADQSPVTGSTDTAVSATIAGLSDGVTYHYRVVAVNAGGTTYGGDITFTTGTAAPTATTGATSSIGETTATLNGTVNANNSDTTVTFQWDVNTNYSRSVEAVPNIVTGSTDTAVSASLSDLIPGTTYYYRVVAVSAGGTTYGTGMVFSTRGAPSVTTEPASAVSTTGATLNGTVNAHNDSTTVTIEYGTTTTYGSTVTADQSPVTGGMDTAVSTTISTLTPDTIYHYRVVAQNVNGTTYGEDMAFITTLGAPTVTTDAATAVWSEGATLNGTVTANNSSTTVTFEYGLDTSYGTTVTADQSPVTGVDVAVSAVLTGLTFNQTYHYRVVGQNANGTTYGADMTFVTYPTPPTAVTNAATGVGGTSATLNGTVNANNYTTTVTFQYGTTTSYGTTVTAAQSPLTGGTDTAVSAGITSLAPSTTYHYRVVAQGFGTAYGADMTFTTGGAPTAVTNAASGVGATGATLNGTVNAANTSMTVTFEYGLNTGYGKVVTADQSPVTGSTDTAVSNTIVSDLIPNTTYHYRVKAQNTSETIYGADVTFTTTGSAPTATTNAATNVTSTGATLNGTVNAKNDSTTVTFQYGIDTSYGSSVTADQSPVTGTSSTAVSKAITSLSGNTTYHYRVVATNSTGTTYGADMTFFTASTAPTATTQAATNVGSTTATLNGTVNANNNSTTVTFEWGPNTGYGRTAVADQSPVTGATDTAVSVNLDSLSPGTTYHFRVVATNSTGTAYGADMTFFTGALAPTVTTAPATNIDVESATLNGLVNANYASTTVTFEYGTDTSYGTTVTAAQSPVTGSTETAVSANITGLSPSTTYHYRVVGENSQGTSYGADMTFTTEEIQIPTVTTKPVTKIRYKTAKSGGNVTDEGASPVTARGVCWSTAPNPTIADNFTVNDYGPGPFNSTLNKLTPGTTYYVRAYATNSYGTAYGEEFQFTTLSKDIFVKIKRPHHGDVVSGTVKIKAVARGRHGTSSIAKVEFYIDDTKIAECTNVPYKTNWDTTSYSDGHHIIKAVAYNEDNQHAEDSIRVRVNNSSTGMPEIAVNRDRLNFGAVRRNKHNYWVTGSQRLLISNNGTGTLRWTISTDADWLSASPQSGKGAHMVKISVDPKGKAAGSYTGSLEIADPNSSNGMVTVDVYLTVYNKGAAAPPFGAFETPVEGSTVSGNIAVTGWALDDIQVCRVIIYRSRVGSECQGLKYIGDAFLVDDARPDIEQTYPDYPRNYKAGWGYVLMTNLLPNDGNGTFTLYAKAKDEEGNTVTLGTKTINVDNASAVNPFGAIDLPLPGQIVDKGHLANFGWALTPQPNTIPFDGSTITVWVDGIPVGHPDYNRHRLDIAKLFPGYNNSDGAGGYFHLNTTSYTSGIHTIAWTVTDDAGNSEGIGSRYFYIVNEEEASGSAQSLGMTADSLEDLEHIEPRPMEPTFIKKGYQPDREAGVMFPDEQGISRVTIKEMEPVELELADNAVAAWGYLVTGGLLKVLPAGSTLDHQSGRFSWLPGPAHVGKYLMVFVIKDTEGRFTRTLLEVTIESKFNK